MFVLYMLGVVILLSFCSLSLCGRAEGAVQVVKAFIEVCKPLEILNCTVFHITFPGHALQFLLRSGR